MQHGFTKERTAGLDLQAAKEVKVSSSVGSGTAFTREGEGDRPTTECDCPDCDCRVASYVWLPLRPRKFFQWMHKERLSLLLELPSRLFSGLLSLSPLHSLLPQLPIASDATCEQLSPRPAMQLQRAVTMVPFSSANIRGVSGFWLIFL